MEDYEKDLRNYHLCQGEAAVRNMIKKNNIGNAPIIVQSRTSKITVVQALKKAGVPPVMDIIDELRDRMGYVTDTVEFLGLVECWVKPKSPP